MQRPAQLRHSPPTLDAVRGDPRFQALLKKL
jgi:hypothetical protein